MTIDSDAVFSLTGDFPDRLRESLVAAVEGISKGIFFDDAGEPLKTEVREVDNSVTRALRKRGWRIETEFYPFANCRFNVDLAIPEHRLLVEIEKGKLPRIELDILKIASACIQSPDVWEYGALIVPTTYITLALAGRQSPAQYLRRLRPLIQPILEGSPVKGILVIGYRDPRA